MAGFCAGLASGGTRLAVLVLVLGTLGLALPANLNALFEDVLGVGGTPGNEGRREPADVGAVAVEADAGHHHLGVFFIEAGVGAKFAGGNAAAEGVEYRLIVSTYAGGGGGQLHEEAGWK